MHRLPGDDEIRRVARAALEGANCGAKAERAVANSVQTMDGMIGGIFAQVFWRKKEPARRVDVYLISFDKWIVC